jgi:hypothetical protein
MDKAMRSGDEKRMLKQKKREWAAEELKMGNQIKPEYIEEARAIYNSATDKTIIECLAEYLQIVDTGDFSLLNHGNVRRAA